MAAKTPELPELLRPARKMEHCVRNLTTDELMASCRWTLRSIRPKQPDRSQKAAIRAFSVATKRSLHNQPAGYEPGESVF